MSQSTTSERELYETERCVMDVVTTLCTLATAGGNSSIRTIVGPRGELAMKLLHLATAVFSNET